MESTNWKQSCEQLKPTLVKGLPYYRQSSQSIMNNDLVVAKVAGLPVTEYPTMGMRVQVSSKSPYKNKHPKVVLVSVSHLYKKP